MTAAPNATYTKTLMYSLGILFVRVAQISSQEINHVCAVLRNMFSTLLQTRINFSCKPVSENWKRLVLLALNDLTGFSEPNLT